MTRVELVEKIEMRTPALDERYVEHCYDLNGCTEYLTFLINTAECYYDWVIRNFGLEVEIKALTKELV